ncbi:MAG: hypothetical protein V7K67_26515 [Nostoc sp.]|uniref:hypothetical protein n=1 Tax=Nostoc sp. TaxID=1180 RepID=UPI002FF7C465
MPTKKPRNPDHARRRNTPQADNEAISEHLQDLLSPAISKGERAAPRRSFALSVSPNHIGRG